MTPGAKKWTGIAIAVLVLGGIAYFAFGKKKPADAPSIDEAPKAPETKPDTVVAPSVGVVTPKPKPKPTAPKPVETGKQVNADDLLAGDVNAGNGKTLVARWDGARIYNMAGTVASQTKKGQVLGVIQSANKVNNFDSYKIVFTGASGAKYFTFSPNMIIRG